MIKSVPGATEKAEYHLQRVIGTAEEIGAKTMLGQALLDLGLLHKKRSRHEKASKYITKSIRIFEECEMGVFLTQAKEAMASLT